MYINNAGVTESSGHGSTDTMLAEEAQSLFNINALAPTILTRDLLPILKHTNTLVSEEQGYVRCFYVSTIMSSFALLNMSMAPSYRASKAALNMYVRCLALDNSDVCFTLVHPGWVATDMGGPNAPLRPQESAQALMKVLTKTTLAKSGKVLESYDGSELPW